MIILFLFVVYIAQYILYVLQVNKLEWILELFDLYF